MIDSLLLLIDIIACTFDNITSAIYILNRVIYPF